MDESKPYGGLSNDRLTALINACNPQSTVREGVDFTYGQPQTYSDSLERNTKVTLTPVAGTEYLESTDVHYWRLPISVLNLLPYGYVKPVIIESLPFSIHGSLSAINLALGVNLTPDEVEDITYSTEQKTYTLVVKGSNSLAWLDSTFEFKAHIVNPAIPLSAVIVRRVLSGLVYVQPLS